MIGQTYGLSHPGVFTSLTLADSTSRWPESALAVFAERAQTALTEGMEPLVASTLGRWFTPAFHQSNPAEVARVAAMIRATPPVGYAASCAAIPRVNTTARLREITCPILVIVGRDDPGTPVEMSRTIHDNAPGSTLVIIDNAAHLSNLEQPESFNRTLGQYLGGVDDRQTR
jgi:3-oxoadipate enol-lactonase